MKTLLENGRILTPQGTWIDGSVLISGDIISQISINEPVKSDLSDTEVIDCTGLRIVPAFIDLQINGCGGVTFNDSPDLSTLEYMVSVNQKTGTAVFLPTLVTCQNEKIKNALESIRCFHRIYGRHRIPGLHLEGPFISAEKSGIHNRSYIRSLDQQTFEMLMEYADELALITVSPEQLTIKQAEQLSGAGIKLSVGHSACSHETAMMYLKKYFTSATHLFNAMTTIINARTPGILCSASEAQLYAGIIADNRHVHPDLVRMAFRIFGRRLFLVTDALASAGAPAELKTFKFCGKDVYIREGGFCSDENGTLAGSSLTMNIGVKNLIRSCNLSDGDAFAMSSQIPAEVLGLEKTGLLAAGYTADIAVIDDCFNVTATFAEGKAVYKKTA